MKNRNFSFATLGQVDSRTTAPVYRLSLAVGLQHACGIGSAAWCYDAAWAMWAHNPAISFVISPTA